MRVDQKSLDQASASQLGKTQNTSAVTSGSGKHGTSRTSAEGDQVSLSNLSSTLLDSVSAPSSDRAARVQQLTALVRSGQYQVDAAAVSHSIVQDSIRA